MEIHATKIKRSNTLIKVLMVLTLFVFVRQYYQTNVFDLGAFANTVAILSLLRGLMLSPFMFVSPIKSLSRENGGFNRNSCKYFLLAIILGIVGAF